MTRKFQTKLGVAAESHAQQGGALLFLMGVVQAFGKTM